MNLPHVPNAVGKLLIDLYKELKNRELMAANRSHNEQLDTCYLCYLERMTENDDAGWYHKG